MNQTNRVSLRETDSAGTRLPERVPSTWCLATVFSGTELAAAAEISDSIGAIPYVPVAKVGPRIHRRTKARGVKPVFPGYVFVGMDRPQFAEIEEHRLVSGLVRFGNQVSLVPPSVLRGIQDRVEAGEFDIRPTGREKPPEPGDTLLVIDGPLAGHFVEVLSVRETEVTVTSSLFTGRPVSISPEHVRHVGAKSAPVGRDRQGGRVKTS